MEIKNVMLPTDFSEPSRMALQYAVILARIYHARLTLLHVVEPQPELEGATIAHRERERCESARQQLENLLAPEDEDDLDLQIVVKSGHARNEIAAAVEHYQADIVVMGTHGRRLLGRLIMGSTTEGLLRKLPVPVMTVCHAISAKGLNRLLFATDFSDSWHGVFQITLKMARVLGADIIAVHALGEPVLASDEFGLATQSEVAAAEVHRRLAVLVAEAKHHGVDVQPLILEGPAPGGIVKAAAESLVDLIILGIDKKGILERALLGTTAEHVARNASVPVLFIPVNVAAGDDNVNDMRQHA
jgi:nucleotide-binding universal stress UspA family protein